uniref:formate C-acetyltransferase n=1 Tax=Agathobaculum sp. TaxID=2048138 RepID=UPI003A847884
MNAWNNFSGGNWENEINVRDFIQKNYTPYDGDGAFLAPATARTTALREKFDALLAEEREKGGVRNIDTETVITITAFGPGYLDKDNEVIVGLQTDEPLKRACNPFGGMRMVRDACKQYGYEVSPKIEEEFKYHKTHNDGVFSAYTKDVREARHVGLLTGLPDAYGRGRIIGDYRRVALYGVNRLIEEKQKDKDALGSVPTTEKEIRCAEELSDQIKALKDMIAMAASYGFDITRPAENAKEAVQWLYFGYLAGIKEQNGAAMSLGRTSTFLDIYFERDIAAGLLTESEAQEIMDDFVLHLRMARHLRTPEYNELFGGDPTWVTESLGGMGVDGRTLVTKNTFRYLHTLTNLGTAPEPNLTVLWSQNLPEAFKDYCARMSIDTDSIQYENDDLMRPMYGDDYCIACCVSAMAVGKQMQFFGARANLAKSLLYAINGGVDELKGLQVIPGLEKNTEEVLDYSHVLADYKKTLAYVAELYVDTINIIHFMHDKYAYEASQMALHDTWVERLAAFGVSGLSVAVDSLSAIKFAKVTPVRDENGVAVDFKVEGEFPKYGNDDDRVDDIAVELVSFFSAELKKHALYRDAIHTLSALTITSNVMYGKKTGTTPDGRKTGEPFAPGANPMHGRDSHGALASLNSVAKIPYRAVCQDGVSNTFSITPTALGKSEEERMKNLVMILNGYFIQGAHH